MTMPRPVLPGETYLITRRCTQRTFLLKPTKPTTDIISYTLACAAKRTQVEIHAACAISNHIHLVVTDPAGRLPEFLSYFHKLVAKAMNASLGRWENFWASEQTSVVRLVDREDVLRKIVYVLNNPVSSRLVNISKRWPGLRGFRRQDNITISRPPVFFRKEGPMPAEAQLVFSVPPAFSDVPLPQYEAIIADATACDETRLRKDNKAKGGVIGLRRVMRQRITDTPNSFAPRRRLRPRIAAKNKWRRIEALRRIKSFLEAYRVAFQQWKVGVRQVIFPPGTYSLRLNASVMVAET